MKHVKKIALCATALGTALTSVPVMAQDEDRRGAPGAEGSPIIVTATRQNRALDEVPISIAAFDQSEMDKRNIRGVEDIARITPGVTFDRTGRGNGNMTNISIRGIRSETGTPTTGIYIDDTPVSVRPLSRSAVNPYPRVFDLERVEVLRGPQGTLFGAGSQGGTLRFITPKPNLDYVSAYGRGEISFTEGGEPSYELGAALGAPIVEDVLGFRLSVWGRNDGGWIDRVNFNTLDPVGYNTNAATARSARLALKFQPADNIAITPSIFYQRTTNADSNFYSLDQSDPEENKYVFAGFKQSPGEDEFYLADLNMEFGFGGIDLISNTSFFDRKTSNEFDSTLLSYFQFTRDFDGDLPPSLDDAFVRAFLNDEQETFTQEVRLQSSDPDAFLNWVAGVFYSHQEQYNGYLDGDGGWIDDMIRAGFGPNATAEQIFGGISLIDGVYILDLRTDVVDEQIAGFAQVDVRLTDRLTATAGLRYSEVSYTNDSYRAGIVVSSNGTLASDETDATAWTPKFGLTFQATDDVMVYSSVAKGFRPGGFQGAAPTRCAADLEALGLGLDPREIQPDSVWSYEIGSKGSLFGNAVNYDVSGYWIDWSNIQSQLNLPCGVTTVANLGSAQSKGVEFSLQAYPTDGLTLSANVGYNHSEYSETTFGAVNPDTGEPAVIRSEGEPLGAAPWTVILSGNYEFPIRSNDGYIRADYSYSSHDDTPLDLASAATDPNIPRTPAVSNLDLRVGIQAGDFDISAFVANVTNSNPELALYHVLSASPVYHAVTLRPRTFGLTVLFNH